MTLHIEPSTHRFSSTVVGGNPIIRNHRVHGVPILPGVGFLDLLYRSAAQSGWRKETMALKNILFKAPLSAALEEERRVELTLMEERGRWRGSVRSTQLSASGQLPRHSWQEHIECELQVTSELTVENLSIAELKARAIAVNDMEDIYTFARRAQIIHESFMKASGTLYRGEDYILAELGLGTEAARAQALFHVHPTFLDASTLVALGFWLDARGDAPLKPYIPIFIEEFRLLRWLGDRVFVHLTKPRVRDTTSDVVYLDIGLYDAAGCAVARLGRLASKQVRFQGLITDSPARSVSGANASSPAAQAPGSEVEGVTKDSVSGGLSAANAPAAQTLGSEAEGVSKQSASEALSDVRASDATIRELQRLIGALVGKSAESVATGAAFYELGLSSTDLLSLVRTIEQRFGIELYPTLLFEYPNIIELAGFLRGRADLRETAETQLATPSTTTTCARWSDPDAVARLYRLQAVPASLPTAGVGEAVVERGALIVVAPALPRAVDWTEVLACAGLSCDDAVITVIPGRGFEAIDSRTFSVATESGAEPYRQLWAELGQRGVQPARILLLGAPGEPMASSALPPHRLHMPSVGPDLRGRLARVFHFTKALLSSHRGPVPLRLVYAARRQSEIENRALAGFFSALKLEKPSFAFSVVDFADSPNANDLQDWSHEFPTLLRELWTPIAAAVVRISYRDGKRYGEKPTPLPVQSGARAGLGFRDRGTYLISGGVGGLGLILARSLAQRYRARLVLIGRAPYDDRVQAKLRELESYGAEAIYRSADVSDPESMANMLAAAKQRFLELHGVIHAAGILEDGLIAERDWPSFERVFAPKWGGARVLDELTKDEPLELFALFSSASALFGSPGQAGYACANGALDGFAGERARLVQAGRRSGRTLSINWPLWKDGGMWNEETARSLHERFGLSPLDSERALRALDDALAADADQVLVLYGRPDGIDRLLGSELRAKQAQSARPQAQRAVASVDHDAPIAVIGLGGRYPEARSLVEFWDNLREGRDCIREIPAERWDWRRHFHPQKGTTGKSYSRWGGFLDGHDHFDPLLFHISPLEASAMDPHERLFLEVAWETLEDASYRPADLVTRETNGVSGRREVGVFVGVMWSDHQVSAYDRFLEGNPLLAGSWFSSIANRVSYFFNFRGPSLPVDTACSSSLVALHLACESLRRGECRYALVGGVNLTVHPNKYLLLSQSRMLSADGRCRSFGADGDGYVPGEGVGAVLLKPLTQAEADGDFIYGVIRGTAVNHGGKTSGYTVPNPTAQAELIREALERAGTSPLSIGYLEAHGTGTALGDPIEIQGLNQAFGREGRHHQRCALGSIKSNIGHLESAAGVAALTKVLLQLRHRTLVPTLHSERVNPHIDLTQSPFYLLHKAAHWPRITLAGEELPRRAGISSFGAGGTNVHAVVEEHVPNLRESPLGAASASELFVLSAKNPERLRIYAERWVHWIEQNERDASPALADIAYTLQIGREPMEHRLAIVARDLADLAGKLRQFCATGDEDEGILVGNGKQNPVVSDVMEATPASQALLRALVDAGQIGALARLWTEGLAVDWSSLRRTKARRVAGLPTYPFARRRCALSAEATGMAARASTALHPLLDSVIPRLTAAASFVKRLSADDALLRNHRVQNVPLLPGTAYLEMARAAVQLTAELTATTGFRQVLWAQPFAVPEGSREAELSLEREGELVRFRVLSRESGTHASVLHAEGQILFETHSVPPPIDLRVFENSATLRLERDEIYSLFDRQQINYGDEFRRLDQLSVSGDTALGRLRPPNADEPAALLPMALFDAALQTTLGPLVARAERDGAERTVWLPFALEEALLLGDPTLSAYTYAQLVEPATPGGNARFELALLDKDGRRLWHVRDFCLRAAGTQTSHIGSKAVPREVVDSEPPLFYRPRWRPFAPPSSDRIAPRGARLVFRSGQGAALGTALLAANDGIDVVLGTEYRKQGPRSFMINSRSAADYVQLFDACPEVGAIYFLADVESGPPIPDQQALSERQQCGALALFRLAQALARSRHAGNSSSVVVVTRQAQTVFEGSEPAAFPYGAALTGLSRVLARERTELRLSVLDANAEELDRDPDSVARAAEFLEGTAAPGQALAVAFRMGQLYAPEIEPLRVDSTDALPIREDGVYLILGGAGGIGTAVSLHLARKVRCRFVWVGRSPLRRSQQKAIEQIEATGSKVLYCQSDARDWTALERVVQQAKQRFGAIHGVIHSALVLKDGALDRLDEASFDEVLTTKVLTSAGLMAVLESETLDFALFFSSAVSFTGPHGQANYAAGCTFQDSFGAYWAERCRASGRHTRVQVINWGYWSETGIVSGSRYREALESQGILGLSTAEGLRALDRIWSCTAVERAIVMKADPRVFGQLGVDYDRAGQYLPLAVRDLGAGLGNALDTFARENPPPSQEQAHADAFERLQAYTRLGVLKSFQSEGVFNESGECHDEKGLELRLAVISQYQRLYRAALDALERAGWIALTEDGWTATAAVAADSLKQRVRAWSEQRQAVVAAEPGLAPHLTLLDRCLGSLTAVLRGECLAPEVLFPAGSMSLVEPIYKGNPLSDHFNHLVAEIVRRAASALPSDASPLRVLEIGAGTGGTSTSVLAALAPFAQRVTYAYTDVSHGFLEFGRKRFGVEYPFVSFKLLDIECDPVLQGFALGGYDIVLASNVLHATRSIASTLRHAKALLGRGGMLVINEITAVQDFTTFTFGLLEGWWLFDDEHLRLPHAPLLAPRAWVRALTEEGFRQPMLRILPDAPEPQSFSQSVVVATSDGHVHRELRAPAEAPLSLPPRRPARPASAVTDPHVECVCERIKYEICALLHIDVAEIDADTPISDLGIDSILAVSAVERINAALAIQLKVAEVFNHATIRALAAHVLSEFEGTIRLDAAAPPVEPASSPVPASPNPASSPTPLVRIQPTGLRCPSFWVHGAHGEVSWAVRLAQQLGRDFPVYGLEAPALKGNDALLGAVPDMAAHYVAAVRSVAPHGPYVLGGYSFGGNVAVEMAHLLRRQGEDVSHIVLLDAYAPGSNMAQGIARAVDETYRLLMIGNIFCTLWKAERFLSPPILTADANESDPTSLRRAVARHLLANARTRLSFDEILALLETSERLAETNGLALERHRPAIHPSGTQTILFQGRHGFVGPENRLHLPPLDMPPNDPTNGWQRFFEAPITVIGLDCDHFGLAAEPFIEQVANRLAPLLP